MFKVLKKYQRHIAVFAAICLVLIALRCFPRAKLLHKYSFSKSFFAKDGELLRITLSHDDKYRIFIPFEEIPSDLKQAVLMYEDKYFYLHPGFNPAALAKASWMTFISKGRRAGASTITMQTARILYNINTKTVAGKIKQIIFALWLEMRYSKKDIFEAYLNIAPYGYNIEGAPAASLIYFNRRVADINLVQALTLAVVPQNPNSRRPANSSQDAMQNARDLLYKKWLKKYPQAAQVEHFFKMPLGVKSPSSLPFYTPHLTNYLDPRTLGSEVFTTIDLPLQLAFEEKTRQFIVTNKAKGIENAAVLLLNAKTMEPQVYIGSADFNNNAISGQVNGVAAKRMAGSVLKSFIYGMALDLGLIHPMTLLKDTPQYFAIYAPENSDRQFSGPVFAKDALVNSRNVPAIDLALKVGLDNFLALLKKGGVTKLRDSNYYGISVAIGSFDISPAECAKLYGAIASAGKTRDIKYLKNASAPAPTADILSPEAAFILLDMLTHNPPPTLKDRVFDKYSNRIKVAWKTGTSYSFKDAWAAGIFGDYIMVVWVGNFSGEGNPYFWGRTAAGSLFFDLVKLAIDAKPQENFHIIPPQDINVKKVAVCASTGDLPGKFCPQTTLEYFIPGKSPIKMSDIHREVLIDKKTGLRACSAGGEIFAKIYEFWPQEIFFLFEQAGIKKPRPPAYNAGCEIEDTSYKGMAPLIMLPVKDIVYYLNPSQGKLSLPLKADTDSDASEVFWFVDGIFEGSSKKGAALFINLPHGRHTVQAVDDLGRHSSSYVDISAQMIK